MQQNHKYQFQQRDGEESQDFDFFFFSQVTDLIPMSILRPNILFFAHFIFFLIAVIPGPRTQTSDQSTAMNV